MICIKVPMQGAIKLIRQMGVAAHQAKTFQTVKETPVLNALKALHGVPISMGRGEIPVGSCQLLSVSVKLFYDP